MSVPHINISWGPAWLRKKKIGLNFFNILYVIGYLERLFPL